MKASFCVYLETPVSVLIDVAPETLQIEHLEDLSEHKINFSVQVARTMPCGSKWCAPTVNIVESCKMTSDIRHQDHETLAVRYCSHVNLFLAYLWRTLVWRMTDEGSSTEGMANCVLSQDTPEFAKK
jgi:hypothetical protein